MSFERVLAADDLWDGDKVARVVRGTPVLLLKAGDRVCAYLDRCPHQRIPLSEGRLQDGVLTCRAHLWSFEACTGKGINPASTGLRSFPVKIEDGEIFVDVDANLGEAACITPIS